MGEWSGWKPLPPEVRALPRLFVNRYATLHRKGEVYHSVLGEEVKFTFGEGHDGLIPVRKIPAGCVYLWRLSAMLSCGYPLKVAGLLTVLFLMWIAQERPTYLSPIEGGYGYIDFRPDDCKSYFGGEKWSRVKKLFCELQDLLKLEKLKGGKWRVIFLLERCDRTLYNDSEWRVRWFGADFKYLTLCELDMEKKTIQYYENKRKAEQTSKDSGGEKKAEQASKDGGGGDVFDGIDFGC